MFVGSLDSPDRKEIARLNSRVVYSKSGHVLYVHEGALLAQAFDVNGLQLRGEPVRIADDLDYYRSTGAAAFSISDTGALIYRVAPGPLELVWFGRHGEMLGPVWNRQRFGNPRISPDGERVAIEVIDPHLGTSDLWMYHFRRGMETRFTTDVNDETMPLWSVDGGRIIFGSDRGAGTDASSDFFAQKFRRHGPGRGGLRQDGFSSTRRLVQRRQLARLHRGHPSDRI